MSSISFSANSSSTTSNNILDNNDLLPPLSSDLVLNIFNYLDFYGVAKAANLNKKWQNLITTLHKEKLGETKNEKEEASSVRIKLGDRVLIEYFRIRSLYRQTKEPITSNQTNLKESFRTDFTAKTIVKIREHQIGIQSIVWHGVLNYSNHTYIIDKTNKTKIVEGLFLNATANFTFFIKPNNVVVTNSLCENPLLLEFGRYGAPQVCFEESNKEFSIVQNGPRVSFWKIKDNRIEFIRSMQSPHLNFCVRQACRINSFTFLCLSQNSSNIESFWIEAYCANWVPRFKTAVKDVPDRMMFPLNHLRNAEMIFNSDQIFIKHSYKQDISDKQNTSDKQATSPSGLASLTHYEIKADLSVKEKWSCERSWEFNDFIVNNHWLIERADYEEDKQKVLAYDLKNWKQDRKPYEKIITGNFYVSCLWDNILMVKNSKQSAMMDLYVLPTFKQLPSISVPNAKGISTVVYLNNSLFLAYFNDKRENCLLEVDF